MKRYIIPLFLLITIAGAFTAVKYIRVLMIGKQANGSYLVSTGQLVSPVGRIELTEYLRPKDLAISPDGARVAVLSTGKLLVYKRNGDLEFSNKTVAAALGICWSPDSKSVFTSVGEDTINEFRLEDGVWKKGHRVTVVIPKDGANPTVPQVLGLAVTPGGRSLIQNSIAKIDIESGTVVQTIPVQMAPFNILMSKDGKTLFVANRAGEKPSKRELRADSAGSMVAVDPKTDAAARGSVSIIDLATAKTSSIRVGRQPNGLVLSPDQKRLYVANSDSDSISIIDVPSHKQIAQFTIRTEDDPEFGRIPADLAISPDGKKLFVACGGINAVAVVALEVKPEVIGYIPSGWFPDAIGADKSGLVVGCAKGIGTRPSDKTTKFRVHDSVGLVQFVSYEEIKNLNELSARVARNNKWTKALEARKNVPEVPVPWRVGEPSVFKHVIYIIKENLTYDLIFGDIKEGNGDPSLCLYDPISSPNQHKLAKEFVLLDNFYTSGTNSADGHQWTSSSICNEYQERSYGASQRSYPYDGGDPMAYSPKGYLWTATANAGRSVRVYGEFVNAPRIEHRETGKSGTFFELWKDYQDKTNLYKITAHTDNANLRKYLHPNYIGFPSCVSDQWRADTFLKEFKEFEQKGNLPSLCMLLLPNNHTSGTNPAFPTPRAMVADNDLALGRIVDAVSHSKYWKDTLIVVVEDDSQSGLDHVDGHRTIAFCISAYTRRGEVVSEFYNHSSMIKTIELVLGIPAMNRFDYSANPMRECFMTKANLTAYRYEPNRIPLDERNPPKTALSGLGLKLAELCERQDWSQYDVADPSVVTRSMWYSVKPHTPFPWEHFDPPSDEDDEED
jgi:YVTN family beta-propeller protein